MELFSNPEIQKVYTLKKGREYSMIIKYASLDTNGKLQEGHSDPVT